MSTTPTSTPQLAAGLIHISAARAELGIGRDAWIQFQKSLPTITLGGKKYVRRDDIESELARRFEAAR